MTAVSLHKTQPKLLGYDTRDIIINYWARYYALIEHIAKDIKFMIQLYSYPIPFDQIKNLLSYEILTKPSSDKRHLYKFELIRDIFNYKTSNPDYANDVIYHPLQPVIPDILYGKYASFTNTNSASVSYTKLKLGLKGTFVKYGRTDPIFKYNGKIKDQRPKIWRCANGKQEFHAKIISYNIVKKSVECELNNEIKHYVLDEGLIGFLQKSIDNGIKAEDLILKGLSAPLRLPNEKYICIISVVNGITDINDTIKFNGVYWGYH